MHSCIEKVSGLDVGNNRKQKVIPLSGVLPFKKQDSVSSVSLPSLTTLGSKAFFLCKHINLSLHSLQCK